MQCNIKSFHQIANHAYNMMHLIRDTNFISFHFFFLKKNNNKRIQQNIKQYLQSPTFSVLNPTRHHRMHLISVERVRILYSRPFC